ncbi:MAG: glycosyltransferase family 39 protein [Deltaproteobacteria bacterium]|nr:glycosyltransferase family 39 protein [Deltaproteobacteria bacterium]
MLDRLRRFLALDRPLWIYAGLMVVALAFGLPLIRRAIILSDEGYLLQQSLDLLQGRVIYRDMDAFITPGMWFLLAGVFAIFEPSVLVSRFVALIAYVALCPVVFRIVEAQTSRVWGVAAVASVLLFSVWAFPAWTFAFYSPFSVLFALMALERLLTWQRQGVLRDLWLTGVLLGLSICFKQNYGIFALVGAALGYLAMQVEKRRPLSETVTEIGAVVGGVVAAGLPFLVYLLWQGVIPDAWESLVIHPFEFGGRHDIPYPAVTDLWRTDLYKTATERLTYLSYAMLQTPMIGFLHPLRLVHRLHVLAYWLAPLIFVCGLGLALFTGRQRGRRIDAALLTTTTTCGLLFLGVLPRADFNHLVNVYQGVLVTLPIVLHHAFRQLGPNRGSARMALAIPYGVVALVYAGVALCWYAGLIRSHTTPIDSPRAGVLVTRAMADEIDIQVRMIERNTRKGEAVLTMPDLIGLNFLTQRPVPSPYYNLYEHHIAKDGGAAVIDGSERNEVSLVVARYDNFFSDRAGLLDYAPELAHYIITHYQRVFVGSRESFIAYRRRLRPEAEEPFIDVLEDCDDADELAEIRQHLLFSALYHKSTNQHPIPEEGVRSRCRVRVPDAGGRLSLELGYRQPYLVGRGTRLRARIVVEVVEEAKGDGEAARNVLFDERFRVVRGSASGREQSYRPVEIDLSLFAGKEVDLLFETWLDGRIQTHPRDFKGFAQVWRDPRVQERAGGARP